MRGTRSRDASLAIFVGIAFHEQRACTLRHSELLGLDLAPGQESRACRRTTVRAVAVVRDHELVRDLERNCIARAPPPQHNRHSRRIWAHAGTTPAPSGRWKVTTRSGLAVSRIDAWSPCVKFCAGSSMHTP